MLVFGRLYTDHEMTVMNASGISRGRVARLLMPLVVVLMCIEGWVSMVAKPWGMERATNILARAVSGSGFDLIRPKNSSAAAIITCMWVRWVPIVSS